MRQVHVTCMMLWGATTQLLLMCGGQECGAPGCVLADEVTDGLIQRIEEHQEALAHLAFVYDVDSNLPSPLGEGGRRTRKTREIFRLTKPPAQDQPHDWLAWEILTEVDRRFQTEWFHVSDGKSTWRFSRETPSRLPVSGIGPKNRGAIEAGFSNQIWTDNLFARMMFMEINGGWPLLDPQKKSLAVQKQFQTAGKTKFLGKSAIVLERKLSGGRLLYRATVLDEPQAMVLRFQTIDLLSNRNLADFRIAEIKTIGKIAYPAQGSYELAESGGRYTFTVEGVILASDCREGWFPAWPPGTIVRDAVTDRVFETKGGEKATPEIGLTP